MLPRQLQADLPFPMHSESTELRRRIGAALARIEAAAHAKHAIGDGRGLPDDQGADAESLQAELGRAAEAHRREAATLTSRIETLEVELEFAKSENARLREGLGADRAADGSDSGTEALRARLKLLSEARARDLETLDEILVELGMVVGGSGEDA